VENATMTMKNREKLLARRLQAATGEPYARCLTGLRELDPKAAVTEVATQELFACVRDAFQAHPDRDRFGFAVDLVTHGQYAATITFEHDQDSVELTVDVTEGAPGYYRSERAAFWAPMGNFLLDEAPAHIEELGASEANSAVVHEGVRWVVARFMDDPLRWNDEGRPANVQAFWD
jgi:hypothetical protein